MTAEQLRESETVGDWHVKESPMFMCPGGPIEPDPCDCGFTGIWDNRAVFIWYEQPGYRRSDRSIRRDIAHGWPGRPHDEGWYVIGGYDERCPACGDIERFDNDAELVAVNVSAVGRVRRADDLRRYADAIEAGAWHGPTNDAILASSVARDFFVVDPGEAKEPQ